MNIDVVKLGSSEVFLSLEDIPRLTKVRELKNIIQQNDKSLSAVRQSLRLDLTGRNLNDDIQLADLDFSEDGNNKPTLYLRDLGPQIGWTTVFLCEYLGPIAVYLFTFLRPSFLYGDADAPMLYVVKMACVCWVAHYVKRIIETIYVHRFSHQTMPLMNLFKNCAYYWGFAFFVGYFINHPNYSEPLFQYIQVYVCLVGFIICELGNLSIHLLLRDLRPAGSNERNIPQPNSNPLTWLCGYVSCPNYSYEIGSWAFFSAMTQSLPAAIFTGVGAFQMTLWAISKHRRYRREFSDYPKSRKVIFPFIF